MHYLIIVNVNEKTEHFKTNSVLFFHFSDRCFGWRKREREVNGDRFATEVLRSRLRRDHSRRCRDQDPATKMAQTTNGTREPRTDLV